MKSLLARVGLAAALTSLLAACGPELTTVTIHGQVQPPTLIPAPAATPALQGGQLYLTDMEGKLGTAVTLSDATGNFSFELRTDQLPQAKQVLRLQYVHPDRKGVLLQQDITVARGRTEPYEARVSPLSTVAALAYEAATRLAPGRVTTDPAGVEALLLNAEGRDTLLAGLSVRYRAYLAGGATAPAEDADLAQEAMELAYP